MRLVFVAALLIALVGCEGEASKPQVSKPAQKKHLLRKYQLTDLAKVDLNLKGHKVEAWVMDDTGKITEGMMYLEKKDVRDDQGMLFVFGAAEARSFWMANCPLGLDLAFMNSKGKILNIQNGKPFDESPLPSKGDAQYVLEMKVGSLKKLGVKAGDTIKIPTGLSHKG